MEISVDNGRCTGLGICESISPDVFEVDEEGALIVHKSAVTGADRTELEQAVQSCPTAALRLLQ